MVDVAPAPEFDGKPSRPGSIITGRTIADVIYLYRDAWAERLVQTSGVGSEKNAQVLRVREVKTAVDELKPAGAAAD